MWLVQFMRMRELRCNACHFVSGGNCFFLYHSFHCQLFLSFFVVVVDILFLEGVGTWPMVISEQGISSQAHTFFFFPPSLILIHFLYLLVLFDWMIKMHMNYKYEPLINLDLTVRINTKKHNLLNN